MMRITVLTLLVMIFSIPASYGQDFFDSLYDIPVMPGMAEVPEMAMSFDKPDGRISQAGAVADHAQKTDILDFYNRSLPQLGWQKLGEGQYLREQEKLVILVEKTGNSSLVRFSLSPNGS